MQQPGRYDLQQFVAGGVAQAVVDEKLSRSMKATVTPRSWRSARSSACARRSRSRARLGKPVSSSWWAMWRMRSSVF
jgi:hypothetical protein